MTTVYWTVFTEYYSLNRGRNHSERQIYGFIDGARLLVHCDLRLLGSESDLIIYGRCSQLISSFLYGTSGRLIVDWTTRLIARSLLTKKSTDVAQIEMSSTKINFMEFFDLSVLRKFFERISILGYSGFLFQIILIKKLAFNTKILPLSRLMSVSISISGLLSQWKTIF